MQAPVVIFSLLLMMTTHLVLGGRVTYPSPYQTPESLFGASNPAPCCRSNYPEEFGSCLDNSHCSQPTAPYCSAFGFCTQQKQYGYNGCVPCQKAGPVYPQ